MKTAVAEPTSSILTKRLLRMPSIAISVSRRFSPLDSDRALVIMVIAKFFTTSTSQSIIMGNHACSRPYRGQSSGATDLINQIADLP